MSDLPIKYRLPIGPGVAISPRLPSLSVLGAGGHGRVLANILDVLGRTPIFYDDSPAWPVRGRFDEAVGDVVIGIGLALPLPERLALCHRFDDRVRGVIAPDVTVHGTTSLTAQILWGALVGVGATVGAHTIIGSRAIIEHDCTVAEGAFIGPGAVLCGGVHVGRCALVGAGAVVLPGVKIPDGGLVRAGEVVK